MLTPEKTYKSKIGFSIWLPLGLILLSIEIFMLVNQVWPGALIVVFVILFIIYLYFDTSYRITSEGTLIIKGGFLIKREIDISSIKKIKGTNNPLSAPAFSFDRLEISYNKYDTILISPEDKPGFIQQLKEFKPGIVAE